jgi:hypothetical protein
MLECATHRIDATHVAVFCENTCQCHPQLGVRMALYYSAVALFRVLTFLEKCLNFDPPGKLLE